MKDFARLLQTKFLPYYTEARRNLRDGFLVGGTDLDSLNRDISSAFEDGTDGFRIRCAEILDLESALNRIWPTMDVRAVGVLADDFGASGTFTFGGMRLRVEERPLNSED